MSTTPQKKYSSLGEKFCRLCGSEKDVDRSTNVLSKSGIRKNLGKTISELLQVSIKEDDGLPSNICRQCEGRVLGFSEFKSSVITMQIQLKQSVTAKRCRVFSPTLEPDQKVRVVENRSRARSLTFADHENTKPESNISSSVLQKNSGMDRGADHVLTNTSVNGKNLTKRPQPLTIARRSPDAATACDPKRGVPVTSGIGVITGEREGGIPVTTSNLEEGVSVTTNTPEGGKTATTTTRSNPNPKAAIILSQAGLNNTGIAKSSADVLEVNAVKKLTNALQTRLPSIIVSTIYNVTPLKLQFKARLLQELHADCVELCKRKTPSILRKNKYPDMVDFSWDALFGELQSRCPILLDIMSTVVKSKKCDVIPPVGLCYAILMQQRNHELSVIQRINTILFSEENAKKQLITRCQRLGICLSHQSKLNLLKLLGGHFADKVIEEVKQGKKLHGTGDNWDIRVLVHDMRTDHQNKDLHYFASNIIVDRVPCDGLSQVTPRREIQTLPNCHFLLNDAETCKLREDFMVLVARVLTAYIPALSFLKAVIPCHIAHRDQKEMAQKSTIISLPMQLKDEKKYDDVVDILCFYENTLEDIYTKAGIINVPANAVQAMPHGSLEGMQSAPDQPGAHANVSDAEDHMKDVCVPFGGDQLTRVRFAGAKDLRKGCHTAKDRFDHCSPFVVEPFHTEMSFLQLAFDLLYKSASIREVGTLKYFREKLNRKNVTPEKVTKSYEGSLQFFLSTGRAYLLEAAMEFFNMDDLADNPRNYVPPSGILHMTTVRKREYFDRVIGAFVDKFVMVDPDSDATLQTRELHERSQSVDVIEHDHDYIKALPPPPPPPPLEVQDETPDGEHKDQDLNGPDRVRYYDLQVIEMAVFLMQLKDTCAEGDGDRHNINKKRLLSYFHSASSFSKYAIEMFTSISQVEALASEELAQRLSWGSFVNWNGGIGNNIEGDKAQEICNCTTKSVVQGIGANKTANAIVTASQAAPGVQQIKTRFDHLNKVHPQSQAHSTRSSHEDEKLMFKDLRKSRPFQVQANISNIEISPLISLDMEKFFSWLEKHKKQISMG